MIYALYIENDAENSVVDWNDWIENNILLVMHSKHSDIKKRRLYLRLCWWFSMEA